MKKSIIFIGLVLVVLSMAGNVSAYPTVFPTGTTIYDPGEAYGHYTLLPSDNETTNETFGQGRIINKASDEVFLIDMNGKVVNKWKVTPAGNKRDRLTPQGTLLHIDWAEGVDTVYEYDWNGKLIWEYKCPTKPHHDVQRLANGNTLILCEEHVPAEKLESVKDVTVPWWGFIKRSGVKLVGDTIIEVTPDKKIVWEWKTSDYLDVNRFSPVVAGSDWTHGNTAAIIPENKWYDQGDKRFKPGNIIFNPRNFDEFVIIDKETKQIVWSWTHKQKGGMSHIHEPNMIPKGLPGAGNIILFDNGLFPRHRDRVNQSWIIELNPSTKDFVWKYETAGYSNQRFASKTKASQSRLPNGNTFISEDNSGRVFQVKPVQGHPEGGVIVWEYVHVSDVSRAAAYPYDYCPQMKNLPKPEELSVTPPENIYWKLAPDAKHSALPKKK